MLTKTGIEGGAVYALSAPMREEIERSGEAIPAIDLRPALTHNVLKQKFSVPQKRQSFSTWLQKCTGLPPSATGMLREIDRDIQQRTPGELATFIKAVPLRLTATAGIERAISTAGGIPRTALNDDFMLKAIPGVFAAGEMLDWEAPTGGYLLQASFATGIAAAQGINKWLSLSIEKQ
ncbi:MAG TPA: NAD(P)/FAD-dependent oxidoreductase, partial [Alphaproteobacteria bacterium]